MSTAEAHARLGERYELVRELAAGAMGRVYQAVEVGTGRRVAAKVLRIEGGDHLESLLRFYQEGALLSTLKHPNIVEVYGTFLEGHTCYIIMELLEGRTLREILRSEQLPLARTRYLARQIASALTYAHSRSIVHRDVKPDNIMVLRANHIKVTDFGIARVLRAGSPRNTPAGVTLGTPLFMAPEQIEGRPVDGRADVYSLAAVMYQMVTGHAPFEDDDPLAVAYAHVSRQPAPPTDLNPALPPEWESLIMQALAKEPDERPASMADFEAALAALPADWSRPPEQPKVEVGLWAATAPLIVPPAQRADVMAATVAEARGDGARRPSVGLLHPLQKLFQRRPSSVVEG